MTEIEKEFCIRAIEFINIAAGEGIWFHEHENYVDEYDASSILFDFFNNNGGSFPSWVPEEIQKDWV